MFTSSGIEWKGKTRETFDGNIVGIVDIQCECVSRRRRKDAPPIACRLCKSTGYIQKELPLFKSITQSYGSSKDSSKEIDLRKQLAAKEKRSTLVTIEGVLEDYSPSEKTYIHSIRTRTGKLIKFNLKKPIARVGTIVVLSGVPSKVGATEYRFDKPKVNYLKVFL